MRLLVFLLLVAVAAVSALDDNRVPLRQFSSIYDNPVIHRFKSGWETFKTKFHKSFDTVEEEAEHFKAFVHNTIFTIFHNQFYNVGKSSFEVGMSEIGDLPKAKYLRLNGFHRKPGTTRNGLTFLKPANVELPTSVDWREKGFVTPVKNQGACGSCWAFSSTGALEGQTKRATGELISLSEQNLVDCSDQNSGCNGGLPDLAFDFVKKEGGLDTEDSYPYNGTDQVCEFKKETVGAKDTGYFDIADGDEDALKAAVATQGPVSVAIDASHETFHLYKTGVYFEAACSSSQLDHAVLVVGYGTDEVHGDYWLVKNSWGETWGENGYIRMARNRDNHCGIASEASYPLVPGVKHHKKN